MKQITPNSRNVIVKTSDGTVVAGHVNLDGEEIPVDRVSDLLVKGKNKFLLVYNARDTQVLGKQIEVILLNKQHILWVIPDEGRDLVDDG